MAKSIHRFRTGLQALLSAAMVLACTLSLAEPPSRVARLGYLSGTVSFSPAGQSDWVQAAFNRPVTTGDRLWVDANSRAELQLGGAAIRMGASTSVTVLNLDDRITQLQLPQGTLKLHVRSIKPNQLFEVDTPNLAFTLRQPGEYRIDVDLSGDATAVMVQSGEAQVYGDGASYAVTPERGFRFFGTGLSDYDTLTQRSDDELDRWSRERDQRGDNSASARYVSSEVVGYEDLDANGTWRSDANYGNVWIPSHVPAGWTPYRDGRWAWVDPWGWTWVDDAPWGYAVSHYGRWAHMNGAWGWVPGPVREQAVYAPALVAFVGGANFQVALTVGAMATSVGWFPLGPREVYRPSYRGNTTTNVTNVTNVTKVTNVTNITNINKVYVNQQVAGAVVAVPAQAFAQSQSVAKAALKVSNAAARSAQIASIAAVAPVLQSVHGGAADAGAKPPVHSSSVVARTTPPAPPVPFSAQQSLLASKPGVPMDDARRSQWKHAEPAATAPTVKVVATAAAPPVTKLPPATPPAGQSPEARKAVAPRLDATRQASPPKEAVKEEAAKPEPAKLEAARAESQRAEQQKAQAAQVEAVKAEAAKAEAAKAETAKEDAGKAEAAKAAATKAQAAKALSVRAEAATAEAAKAEAAKAEAVKAEAVKASRVKAEATTASTASTARAEAATANAARADAARAARVDAVRAQAAQKEASRPEPPRAVATQPPAAAAPAPEPPPAARPREPRGPAARPPAESKVDEEKKRAQDEAAQKR